LDQGSLRRLDSVSSLRQLVFALEDDLVESCLGIDFCCQGLLNGSDRRGFRPLRGPQSRAHIGTDRHTTGP